MYLEVKEIISNIAFFNKTLQEVSFEFKKEK
jgi:hypothetical protein